MTSREEIQIDELLIQWEELRRSGEEPSAEEICAEAPELREELKQRIAVVQQMEAVLGMSSAATQEWTDSSPLPPDDAPGLPAASPNIPNHEIHGLLGHGGMGVVYKARHVELGRTVAVKMIDRSAAGPKRLSRFRDEARAVARLDHANIVQIYEFGEAEGTAYFSMEYVDGGSLKDRLTSGPIEPHEAAEILVTIAEAIHVAHEHGFVHRDLKPANILISSHGEPKITDFGLVKHLHEDSGHTETGDVLGTFGYMAPEQVDDTLGAVDARTDVYALGAILYHLLTGKPVFESPPAQAIYQILHGEIRPPAQVQRSVPRDLDAICMMCLEKRPGRRYATAQDLATDLRNFLNAKPVTARRAGPAARGLKWIRRHPFLVTAAALAAVLLAAAPLLMALPEYRAQAHLRERAVEVAPQAREILQRNCYQCHGLDPYEIEKDLKVLDHAALVDAERPMVVPGSPGDSRLIQRIADGSMPPVELETELPRLANEELEILNEWIVGGAPPFPDPSSHEPIEPVIPTPPSPRRPRQSFSPIATTATNTTSPKGASRFCTIACSCMCGRSSYRVTRRRRSCFNSSRPMTKSESCHPPASRDYLPKRLT